MKYMLDMSGYEFEVVKTAAPKLDGNGAQKIDPVSKNPVWVVEVNAFQGEDAGVHQMDVTLASATKPDLRWRQPVELSSVEMIPWANNGRSGVAFRVGEIRPVDVARLQSVA
ncbi:hypothetical protein ACPPVO_52055 [Dactylosporangium sp. McL0621]|uniref:hypothetical protein n=1 Tax=Dactylosporangium sp. McL0621 TaxID=3415678 RepID=UPI003CEB06BD